ncbi:MAG: 30S ribosomal protein S1 [Alphaproteobacteria bacterium]|nr:MAG: 30S ribosomal protein S1 [Alphaproteobacteria bacterium]
MARTSAVAKKETTPSTSTTGGEDFASLLKDFYDTRVASEGKVVKGLIVSIDGDYATVDVGLKSEGRIPLREFALSGQAPEIKAGDSIDVYIERYEDRDGMAVLSRERAKREESWTVLEKSHQSQERVTGVIFGKVKGGFTVDLNGAVAFLPASQVDIRPVRDVGPLMNTPQPFQILKMDRKRGNIVVSRRAILEESRAEARNELVSNISEGQILTGTVKNITDYGAFIDLGGIDGLLHVTDISWKRVNHPSEVLSVGQQVKVQVIRFNQENGRISLGMKQLEQDPWAAVQAKYPPQTRLKGRVTNIADYGAFVEIEPGVEGLVHVSEMSWTKKNVHPSKILSTSQEVEVMVLDMDLAKRRISLGLKQCMANPWDQIKEQFPSGAEFEGEIKNVADFGLFIGLIGDVDGLVHANDIDWNASGEEALKNYKKGDKVKVKVLDIDPEKERVALGIKQLTGDPFEGALSKIKKGDVVTCTITSVVDAGLEVTVVEGVTGFIRKGDLSRDRSEQRSDRFAVGEKIDAKITGMDKATRKVTLSVKAREIDEEKQAMEEYGSTDSGARLGDILGAALGRKSEAASEEKPKAAKKKKEKAESSDTAE